MGAYREVYYEGKTYQCRYVDFVFESFWVGTESLEDALMNEDKDDMKDEDARAIDDTIYCYVPDEIFKKASDNEFKDYVEKWFM